MMTIQEIKTPYPLTIHCSREEFATGPLPTLFYFSLSSIESLSEPPFSSLLLPLQDVGLNIISFSLPFHEKPEDKFHAMVRWAEEIKAGSAFLEDFLENGALAIRYLIEQELVKSDQIALAGLSRGAFIASLLAEKEKRIETLLGLAPLTDLSLIEEFKRYRDDVSFSEKLQKWQLHTHVDELLHLRSFRFYIGNRDERVSVDSCFQFVRKLAESANVKHARHANFELFITQSIGFKGHGTSQAVFHEAGEWLKSKLLS